MRTWSQLTMDDIRMALGDSETLDFVLAHETTCEQALLECLELEELETIAEDSNLLHSEVKVSENFDSFLDELEELDRLKLINDEVALNECFNNYVDSLHCDDLLHSTQVNNYEYVGYYS